MNSSTTQNEPTEKKMISSPTISGSKPAKRSLSYASTTSRWSAAARFQGRVTNAVLLLHGTNGSGKTVIECLGPQLFGRGQPLDSAKYYLIIPDGLGCGASSKPSDGLRAKFPRYGYNDMVEAQKLLIEGLGVNHLRAIIGLSMGAMHAWIWGGKYPDMMDGLMPLVAMPAPITGHNLFYRRVVTECIRHDPDYNGGNYAKQPSRWVYALPTQHILVESRVRTYEAAPTRRKASSCSTRLSKRAVSSMQMTISTGSKRRGTTTPNPTSTKSKRVSSPSTSPMTWSTLSSLDLWSGRSRKFPMPGP